MAGVPTQIRIDSEIKKQSSELFNNLGIDMSSAINMLLHQCVFHNGLPFSVDVPHYSQETLDARKEANRISCGPDIAYYTDIEPLKSPLAQ